MTHNCYHSCGQRGLFEPAQNRAECFSEHGAELNVTNKANCKAIRLDPSDASPGPCICNSRRWRPMAKSISMKNLLYSWNTSLHIHNDSDCHWIVHLSLRFRQRRYLDETADFLSMHVLWRQDETQDERRDIKRIKDINHLQHLYTNNDSWYLRWSICIGGLFASDPLDIYIDWDFSIQY